MTIGERIKKFRTDQELSQKELAIMSGMSEPAIRNYELGNRRPNQKQIEKIAGALKISPFAIADPDFETDRRLIHALFQMEDMHGLIPQEEADGQVVLTFDRNNKSWHTMLSYLLLWNKELKALKDENITKEEYDLWRYSYPRLQAEKEAQERRELRAKKRAEEKE